MLNTSTTPQSIHNIAHEKLRVNRGRNMDNDQDMRVPPTCVVPD